MRTCARTRQLPPPPPTRVDFYCFIIDYSEAKREPQAETRGCAARRGAQATHLHRARDVLVLVKDVSLPPAGPAQPRAGAPQRRTRNEERGTRNEERGTRNSRNTTTLREKKRARHLVEISERVERARLPRVQADRRGQRAPRVLVSPRGLERGAQLVQRLPRPRERSHGRSRGRSRGQGGGGSWELVGATATPRPAACTAPGASPRAMRMRPRFACPSGEPGVSATTRSYLREGRGVSD